MPVLKPSFLSTYIAIKTNKFNKLREFTNEESLCDAMDYSPPGSSVNGIVQARILEWVTIPFSRGSSLPRDQTQVSCIACRLFTV